MRSIQHGRLYSTAASELICECESATTDTQDFHWWQAGLYRTRRGRFFLAGAGGPMTRWAHQGNNGTVSGSKGIIVLTSDEARQYAEQFADVEVIARYWSVEEA